MLKVPKIISMQYFYKITRKKGDMKLIFCLQIKIKFSYKLRPSILLGIASHAQNTQSNKFAKSLQYLKKKVRDEVDFLCR